MWPEHFQQGNSQVYMGSIIESNNFQENRSVYIVLHGLFNDVKDRVQEFILAMLSVLNRIIVIKVHGAPKW